jgi:hypothetical protein
VSGRSLSKKSDLQKGKKENTKTKGNDLYRWKWFGFKIQIGCVVGERRRVEEFQEERRQEKKRSFGLVSDPLKRQLAKTCTLAMGHPLPARTCLVV